MVEYKIANEKGKSVDEDIKGNGICIERLAGAGLSAREAARERRGEGALLCSRRAHVEIEFNVHSVGIMKPEVP